VAERNRAVHHQKRLRPRRRIDPSWISKSSELRELSRAHDLLSPHLRCELRADLRYPDETSEDTTDLAFRAGGPWGATWRVLSGFRLSDFTLKSSLEGDVPFLTPFLGERFRTYRTSLALAIEAAIGPPPWDSADAAYEWVEGDVSVQRPRARASLYVPLDRERRHLLTFSGQAEALRPYGSTAETGIPRFERLFLGSENDLRGFSIRGVGPREGDVVVGGDRLIQGSLEYVFGLGSRLRLVGSSTWETSTPRTSRASISPASATTQALKPRFSRRS
jgi:hypothetical protein